MVPLVLASWYNESWNRNGGKYICVSFSPSHSALVRFYRQNKRKHHKILQFVFLLSNSLGHLFSSCKQYDFFFYNINYKRITFLCKYFYFSLGLFFLIWDCGGQQSAITFPIVAWIHLVPLALNKGNNVCTFLISFYLDPWTVPEVLHRSGVTKKPQNPEHVTLALSSLGLSK